MRRRNCTEVEEKTALKRELHSTSLLAEKALWVAVAGVIEEHRQDGDPLVVWRNKKVAWISAEEAQQDFNRGSIARWGRVLKARKTVLPSNWGMGGLTRSELKREAKRFTRQRQVA